MSTTPLYLLDSDVFIAAKNSYYAFAICPGFWDSLIHHYDAGNVRSIDRVRGELLAGRKTEDLKDTFATLEKLDVRYEWREDT